MSYSSQVVVRMPSSEKSQLEALAETLNTSVSQIVRQAVEKYNARILVHSQEDEFEKLLTIANNTHVKNAPKDLAENHDHYLYGDK